ncbi:MAG: DUF6320 domain-containing protein [Lachnospiraceae bacterium]|nr:DUF6320 domain-containing protein [Lachnospiraceae bacterium]
MSYCVNCGVKLDRTAKRCPLCNTPIVNPKEIIDPAFPTPFPKGKGQVEQVRHSDLAILISVVLGSTAIACGLINILVSAHYPWSLYVIGACVTLWVFFTPAIIYTRIPSYVSVLLDGFVLAVYCYLVSIPHPGNGWFFQLAIPIISAITFLVILFVFLTRNISTSILSIAIYFFSEISVFCLVLDILIKGTVYGELSIGWSIIVLICCVCIDIILITIIKRTRLREEVRRRMHI